jgi:hypothetical protein
VRSSYAKTLGRPDVRRAIAKHGTGSLPVRGALAASQDGLGFEALSLGGSHGSGAHSVSPARQRRSPPPRGSAPPPVAPPPAAWAHGTPVGVLDRAWGSDASGALNSGGSAADCLGFTPGPSGALYDIEGAGGCEDDALTTRCEKLQLLTAAQRRALDAMAADRAALEAALSAAQLRFKAELDARRGAEQRADAVVDALTAERERLAAARAAWAALLSSAEGATETAQRLEAARAGLEAASQELVAQRALAEDATHELGGAAGRVAYECALEREAAAAQHAAQVVDVQRQLARARAELEQAASQQAWELDRMRAAAEATAGVAADALSSADARKRDLEGVNDALASLSERLYVGSLSIGALGICADGGLGGGSSDAADGARRTRAADSRDEEVAARQQAGRYGGGGGGGGGGGNGGGGGGSFAAVAVAAAAAAHLPLPGDEGGSALQWGLAPPPRQAGAGRAKAAPVRCSASPPPRRGSSPTRGQPAAGAKTQTKWGGATTRRRGRQPA